MTEPVSSDLTGVFQRLQSVVLSTSNLESFLQQQLSELATGAPDQPISCGITSRRDRQPLTVASSDARASGLDESQYTVEEGPYLHTLATGRIVLSEDIDQETRWPAYLDRAKPTGLRCSLSMPQEREPHDSRGDEPVRVRPRGHVHRHGPAPLRTVRRPRLMRVATDPVPRGRQQLLDQLDQALASRTNHRPGHRHLDGSATLHRGPGFRPATDAFNRPKTKLRDVAADLIARVTGQPPRPGRPFDRSTAARDQGLSVNR